MTTRQFALAAMLALAGGELVCGADGAGGKADAQASFEPRSDPGAGQKYLAAFVGQWEVTKTFYPRTGEPVKASGTCQQSLIHSGRFLKSEFVFHSAGEETTGLGIIGWDADTKKFTSFWTDSRSTRISIRQSQEAFDGNQIVLWSASLDPAASGAARKSKTISRLEDNGRRIVHRQYALGPADEERLVMELVLTRKEAAKQPDRG